MKTLKFKTNIKCGGCSAAVTPFLNNDNRIDNWQVDTLNPDKILTVNSQDISSEQIIALLKDAGFEGREF